VIASPLTTPAVLIDEAMVIPPADTCSRLVLTTVAPFLTTGATLVLIRRFVGHESERDNLVSCLADNRDGGQGGGSAPQGKRQVVGGEVPQVHGAGYVGDALDGGVYAARGAGVVNQLLFLFGKTRTETR
jgi:hypothetical protein